MSFSATKEVRAFPCRGPKYDNQGLFAGLSLDGDDRVVESVANPRQRQRIFARHVVLAAIAELPVIDDFEREFLQRLDRRDEKKPLDAVGSAGAADIVDIHVGDRRGDDLAVLIVNRIMQQGEIDRCLAAPFGAPCRAS